MHSLGVIGKITEPCKSINYLKKTTGTTKPLQLRNFLNKNHPSFAAQRPVCVRRRSQVAQLHSCAAVQHCTTAPRSSAGVLLKNIPWDITIQIEKAQKVLREMYLSLNTKDKEFAEKYLLYDLIDFKVNVDTGLPIDFISESKLKNSGLTESINFNHKITDIKKIISIYQNFIDQACIYCFINPNFSYSNLYIGQTQNVFTRLKYHY